MYIYMAKVVTHIVVCTNIDSISHTHTHTHTLRIDSLIENELAMSEEVEERLKVLRTSINEVGPTGVRGTAPAWEGGRGEGGDKNGSS